jgi:outer membrane protein
LLNLIGQFEFDSTLGEVSMSMSNNFAPSFDVSYQLARDNQPDYLAASNALKQLEIDVAAAKRNRLPSLDLGGAVGYNSRDSSASSAIDRLPNGDGYAWQVDLSLKIPWGMRSEKARYNTALNYLRRQETRVRQIEQDLTVQVRSAVRSVETNQASVEISHKATELSAKQYELEKARFDAGLSTSRRVLEAQDDLETARVAELQARVNLRTAAAELQRLDGSSLAYYNISLDDQMVSAK